MSNTTTLPIYRKGGTRYALTAGKAFPIIYRRPLSGAYRNSKKALPDGLGYGRYLGTPSKVDQTELDFIGLAEFETVANGFIKMISEIRNA